MAATVECGKLVLMALPNIEIVTILLALYGYVFGLSGVLAAVVFVAIEPLIWGFSSWVISYFLYWPLVPLVFMLISKLKLGFAKNRFFLAGVAVILTIWFGVLTTLVDTGLFSGLYENFLYRFSVMYVRGLPFYITQIVCNKVLFITLFPFLAKRLDLMKHRI